MPLPTARVREWVRDGYMISTDPALIDTAALNAAFASSQLPWAHALPEDEMKLMLEKSVCFGLYSPTAQALPPPEADPIVAPALTDVITGGTTSEQSPADTLHELAERVHIHARAASTSNEAATATAKATGPDTGTGTGTGTSTEVDATSNDRPAMIGLARLITDNVTVVWLTDVYVLPDWQGQGLGSWLNTCIKEWVDSMPHLRRLSLIAEEGRMEQTYAKVFGTRKMEDEGTGYRIYSAKGKGGQL